ncbi:MAG: exonuclease SbcD [Chlamydiales bacterium]|jgi:exonuclease SbcD
MAFRFLHLADLHLETHFGGRPATRARLRSATIEAFGRAVDYAIQEKLHALLVAGDLFDDPLLSLPTEIEIVRAVERLTAAGVWVLYACGNHDPGGAGKRAPGLDLGRESVSRGRVHVFRSSRPEPVRVLDRDGVEVGVVVGAGHETDHEARNLAQAFPRLDTDLPVVGLLHTQVESARAAEEHDRYAPSTAQDFVHPGYAYWAIGHVHIRQQAIPDMPVWYCGNLQGRNARERGPKGGLLVEARAGGSATPTFVPFAPVRWERIEVEGLERLSSIAALVDVLTLEIEAERQRGDEELAVRLALRGATPLAIRLRDTETRRELEQDLIARGVALEVEIDTRDLRMPRDMASLHDTPSVLQAVFATVEEARREGRLRRELAPGVLAGFDDHGDDAAASDRQRYLLSLLDGIEEDILERCFEPGAP